MQEGHYPEYDRTNQFYKGVGFQELECFPTLWGEKNPCQIFVMFDPIHTRDEIDTALSLFCIVAEARKHRHPAADWPVEERFRWLTAVKSSCVSTSRPHPGFAEDLDSEFDRLYKELVI